MSDLPHHAPASADDVPYADALDSLLMKDSESITTDADNPLALQIGDSLPLPQLTTALHKLHFGLGWDVSDTQPPFDLDVSVFLLAENGRVRGDHDLVFYNQTASACGSVMHSGDNRTGHAEGEDEVVLVDLQKLPADVQRIVFAVTIHEAAARNHHFGQVKNAFIRAVDLSNQTEILRYTLDAQFADQNALLIGELARQGDSWVFHALGEASSDELLGLTRRFGIAL